MGAMPEEIHEVVHLMTDVREHMAGMRTYYSGLLNGKEAVVVFSRWGKTAAAATATTLILEFGVTELVFTGVAGAIDGKLKIGDIVVADRLIQHDMDARPLMPRYEIPLLGKTYFDCDRSLKEKAMLAVRSLTDNKHLHEVISDSALQQFGIQHPEIYTGDIASGDKFFADNDSKQTLSALLPDVRCVEMEGAAVAQVCYEYGIPFVVIRTISDTADEHSEMDFQAFINSVSSKYSRQIIRNMFG